jgi:hypothetical protein
MFFMDYIFSAASEVWVLWPKDTLLHISSILTTDQIWQMPGMLVYFGIHFVDLMNYIPYDVLVRFFRLSMQ